MIKFIKRVLFQDELKQLHDALDQSKRLNDQLTTSINHAKKVNDRLQNSVVEICDKYKTECDERKKLLEEMESMVKLEKIYCYLIPKLINSSGIDIPEDFDITNFEDAEKLYKRFRCGDLLEY